MRKRNFLKAVAMTLAMALLVSGTAFAATPGQALDGKEVKYGTVSSADASVLRTMFDAEYYAKEHEDVARIVGKNANALFNHFLRYGIFEGRAASKDFNVSAYKSSYGDLQKAFKDDIISYYLHYAKFGKAEKRELVTVEKAEAAGVTIQSVVPGATKTVLTPKQEAAKNPSAGSGSSNSSSSTIVDNTPHLSVCEMTLVVGGSNTVSLVNVTSGDNVGIWGDEGLDEKYTVEQTGEKTWTITALAEGEYTLHFGYDIFDIPLSEVIASEDPVEPTEFGEFELELTITEAEEEDTTPASVEISGAASIPAPETQATSNYTATVKNEAEDAIPEATVTWSLDGEVPVGFAISEAGVLTIPAGISEETSVTIKATATGTTVSGTKTVTITVEDEEDTTPATIEITGEDSITASTEAVTETYTAVVKNASTETLTGQTIVWSVDADAETAGYSIDGGVLTVPANAEATTVTITATVSETSVTTTKVVTIEP